MISYIVNYSFGESSWAAAKIMVAEVGKDRVKLLFCDTHWEDEETYRWGREAAANVGCELIEISDGRNPLEVFRDERFVGNSRIDPCSKILKRQLADKWFRDNCDPATTVRVFGIHSSESDRFRRWDEAGQCWRGIQPRLAEAGWQCRAPLCESGTLMGAEDVESWVMREIGWRQRMYAMGFPHANCGGRCCKQGQTGWALTLKQFPDRFAECEEFEREMSATLGKTVSFLQQTVRGVKIALPLSVLRGKIESNAQMPLFDFGACACFAGTD